MSELRTTLRSLAEAPRFAAIAGLALMGFVHGSRAATESRDSPVLEPGQTIELVFPETDVPPTLYAMMHGIAVPACMTVRLPDDYTPTKTFPLVLYVPGNDGGTKGNIHNAATLAGARGWIAATLPLFKKSVDRSEPAGGVIVSLEDYPVLSRAYAALLGRLFKAVPNIDPAQSAMVGFSNGAITIGVLLSNHDEFVLTHFRNFCLVDNGMFHLTDLHRSRARKARFLILAGDQPGMGRDLKIRQGQLQQDAWRLLGVDLSFRVMDNTGHEFNAPQIEIVRTWLRSSDPATPTAPPDTTTPP